MAGLGIADTRALVRAARTRSRRVWRRSIHIPRPSCLLAPAFTLVDGQAAARSGAGLSEKLS